MEQLTDPLQPVLGPLARPFFFLGESPVSLMTVVTFALIVALTVAVSLVIQRLVSQAFRRRGIEEGVGYAVNRLLHYAVLAIGVYIALDNLGVSIAGLAALGAILGVGIGFGLQNIVQNFVSGLILLLERPIKQGDFVQVGEATGTVREIRARATVVTTLDNVDILVPNGQFITETVVNQTFGDRKVRVGIAVGVAYGSDTGKVRDTLLKVASEHKEVLDDPSPVVEFCEFGDSSLNFDLECWLSNPLRRHRVASDLRFAIDAAFREREIEIPFPQRDLHLRSGWKEVEREG
ncbi:MAG: mechanosensitive ion channel family protein [Longimicrobiaceae bacterium]